MFNVTKRVIAPPKGLCCFLPLALVLETGRPEKRYEQSWAGPELNDARNRALFYSLPLHFFFSAGKERACVAKAGGTDVDLLGLALGWERRNDNESKALGSADNERKAKSTAEGAGGLI